MRIALFGKFFSLSLAAAAMMAASGCSNCGTPACAPAPQACVIPDCGSGNVTYRPDLYAAVSCLNPAVSQRTAAALTQALDEAPAKPAVVESAPVQVEKQTVLPPVMPEARPAPAPQPVAAGCFVPADTPLAPVDVAPYVAGEHYDVVEPEIIGEPLPPMPTFRGQWSDEPAVDPAP